MEEQAKAMVKIQLKLLRDNVSVPRYMTPGAAGMDVAAVIDSPVTLAPSERVAVPTGLAVAIPSGYEVQVRPRSGLAFKQGITVVNAPGTIDSDYRGEIKILLINLSDKDAVIENGERIAQLVVAPVSQCDFEVVSELSSTDRGAGGFGSTGVK